MHFKGPLRSRLRRDLSPEIETVWLAFVRFFKLMAVSSLTGSVSRGSADADRDQMQISIIMPPPLFWPYNGRYLMAAKSSSLAANQYGHVHGDIDLRSVWPRLCEQVITTLKDFSHGIAIYVARKWKRFGNIVAGWKCDKSDI